MNMTLIYAVGEMFRPTFQYRCNHVGSDCKIRFRMTLHNVAGLGIVYFSFLYE